MKNKIFAFCLMTAMAVGMLTACGQQSEENAKKNTEQNSQVASQEEMATILDVTEEGMKPILGEDVTDGEYAITVDSSSPMFQIVECKLIVKEGKMTAIMTMGGKGYQYLYMGTGEKAVKADEKSYIPYETNAEGAHTYTVPVEALNKGIDCAAFSKKKEKWYDRTLVFRSDSLPAGAYTDPDMVSCEQLQLKDGTYTVEVRLQGGSGKADVESPAKLVVENKKAVATIVWSSPNYDYMLVGEEKHLNQTQGENATFIIPVIGFDYPMPVMADTTAMSEPHEIAYTLQFDSATIK